MKLFRRVLLSLFPEELSVNAQHPVSMFLSLISPRQFFNIIHRRITENFKLNLYDISLDPFEVKIGFGSQPTLQVKDIDVYYAYDVVAQINGWNYYAPGNIATAASLVFAYQGRNIRQSYAREYGYAAILSIYLLTFLFVARIRIFPEGTKEYRYQRCIDLFFSFYTFVLRQQGVSIDKQTFAKIKKDLLLQVPVFFFLFYFYQKVNTLFVDSFATGDELYQWLFSEEKQQPTYKEGVTTFLLHWKEITKQTTISSVDELLGKLIFPTDIQLKYLLQGDQGVGVITHLIGHIYDPIRMEAYLRSFLKTDDALDEFLQWLLDRKVFQQHYFQGMKQVAYQEFRLGNDYAEEQEVDEFISSLESGASPQELTIPESLKREGIVMDRLMNFYLSFLGGLRTGRGDAFGGRRFKKELIQHLSHLIQKQDLPTEALQRYGGLIYAYNKNLFYYSYAYEHIRAGKEVFHLPYTSAKKELQAHTYLLRLFDEHFLYTLFQDIQDTSIVITVSQSQLVHTYKHLFKERLRACIDADAPGLLTYIYGPLGRLCHCQEAWHTVLEKETHADDLLRLKEHIYAADLHIWVHATELLAEHTDLFATYGAQVSLGICATLKETLFGFLLYITYLQAQEREQKTSFATHILKHIYIADILHIAEPRQVSFEESIDTLLIMYHPLLELWIQLDDNTGYFALGLDNRTKYSMNKDEKAILADVTGDDIVWNRGFYKTITYYNKRIVRPK